MTRNASADSRIGENQSEGDGGVGASCGATSPRSPAIPLALWSGAVVRAVGAEGTVVWVATRGVVGAWDWD